MTSKLENSYAEKQTNVAADVATLARQILLMFLVMGLFVIPAAASDTAIIQIGQSGTTGSISAVDVTVQVKNKSGSTVSGARVYHEGNYIGVTNTSGSITVNNVEVGDTLAASYLVYTEPAVKAGHTMGGSSAWAWRVYLTSVDIPDSGTPQLFTVSDTSQVQVLTVRKDQALIGVHIVAVVEFDATSAYLDDLEQSLINASAFLYDVTDGQMLYEVIEIYDNTENGAASDYVFLADNSVGPNAYYWWHGKEHRTHIISSHSRIQWVEPGRRRHHDPRIWALWLNSV